MRYWIRFRSFFTAIIYIVGLVVVGNFFLTWMLSRSVVYLRNIQVERTGTSCSLFDTLTYTVHLRSCILADSEAAVPFRGAPWKAEVGRWLSSCHHSSAPIDVSENIYNKECKNGCSSRGVCNRELGECRCFHGFAGEGCEEELKLECNLPALPEWPNGPWIVSICPQGHCNTRKAKCYCGEGTAYPNRPLIQLCGFQLRETPGLNGGITVDWAKVDEDVFGRNGSRRGWCNVDPKEAYEKKVKYKTQCDCRYDGYGGTFGEIPIQTFCINQCSSHGRCDDGSCHCDRGWYGVDCSIPSSESAKKLWPKWLRPSSSDQLHVLGSDDEGEVHEATVRRNRPLIYVYDLPPEFNTHHLEGRHDRGLCTNRLYDNRNRTSWIQMNYGGQIGLYESMLSSPHRTMNAEEADYFYVPVLDSCTTIRADHVPHFKINNFKSSRCFLTLDVYKKAYDHIVDRYPYWNRLSGRDHIWYFSWDEGACCAPKEIWNSMMLTHFGNTNSKHKRSTTAYWADTWDNIPLRRRGNHTCFDPAKDLVIPSWKMPQLIKPDIQVRPRGERKILFYFNGNLGPAYENGRPEAKYSMGIRQKVAEEFGSTPDKEGRLGKQRADDVIVSSQRSDKYAEELENSTFCGVFPGDGWSGRMEDSILNGCIPVIIQDGIYLPYENVLDYGSFAVRIAEDDIPKMVEILRAIEETRIDSMHKNVLSLRTRFMYRDSIMLEATRQELAHGAMDAWGEQFSELEGDDVFSTFIQVLHYKLHNDPWRLNLRDKKKDRYGLPKSCTK